MPRTVCLYIMLLAFALVGCKGAGPTRRQAEPPWEPPVALGERNLSAEDYLNYGDRYLTRDNTVLRARQAYLKTLELTDDAKLRARAFIGLGEVYQLWREYPRAISYYSRAATLDPTSASAFMHLGVAVFARGRQNREGQSEALDLLTRATRLDPSYGDPIAWKGLIYHARGEVGETIFAYERALALGLPRPLLRDVIKELGVAYGNSGRFEEALAMFLRLRREFPEYDGAQLQAQIDNARECIRLRDEGRRIAEEQR